MSRGDAASLVARYRLSSDRECERLCADYESAPGLISKQISSGGICIIWLPSCGAQSRGKPVNSFTGTVRACLEQISTPGFEMLLIRQSPYAERPRSRVVHGLAVALSCLVWVSCVSAQAAGQPAIVEIEQRQAAERIAFSDEEIKDGFFKTALGAELAFDKADARIRKFDGPVRVFVAGRGPRSRADLERVVADIAARVDHLDLAMVDDAHDANVMVTLVRRSDFATTVKSRYGAERARQIESRLQPECLSGIGIDKQFNIRRAEIILPVDAGEFTLLDCAYEELLQALGVVNDDRSVPWTMFNDDVQMGFFDIYDQHVVNILYDPRIKAGMTHDEAEAVVPKLLPDVRSWVMGANPAKPWRPAVQPDQACACGPEGTASK